MDSIETLTVECNNSPQQPYIFEHQSKEYIQQTLENALQSDNREWLFWKIQEGLDTLCLTINIDNQLITFTSQCTSESGNGDYYHFTSPTNLESTNRAELFKMFKKASNGSPMGMQYISTSESKNRSAWNFIVGSSDLKTEL
jgi:hypothetical protein